MRKQMRYPPIHKRFYLLIEVLVALALVTLLAIPLMRPLFNIVQEEHSSLERLKLETQADFAFFTLCEWLYENKIDWNELSYSKQGKGKTVEGELTSSSNTSSPLTFRDYRCAYQIRVDQQKNKGSGPTRRTYRLLAITITLTPQTKKGKKLIYHYNLFAQRLNKELFNGQSS